MAEGPLAGGHLGFGMDWAQYDLATIVAEIAAYLKAEQLDIPLIPAGGIFTGSDAVAFLESGAAAVQVATRFTVARECGLPEDVQQEYYKASEQQIVVNHHGSIAAENRPEGGLRLIVRLPRVAPETWPATNASPARD